MSLYSDIYARISHLKFFTTFGRYRVLLLHQSLPEIVVTEFILLKCNGVKKSQASSVTELVHCSRSLERKIGPTRKLRITRLNYEVRLMVGRRCDMTKVASKYYERNIVSPMTQELAGRSGFVSNIR